MTRSILTILTLFSLTLIPVEQLGHRQVTVYRGGLSDGYITLCGNQQYVRGVHREVPEQYEFLIEMPKVESGE